jgi:hypothetical protein
MGFMFSIVAGVMILNVYKYAGALWYVALYTRRTRLGIRKVNWTIWYSPLFYDL